MFVKKISMYETINIKQFYSYICLKLETKFINNRHRFQLRDCFDRRRLIAPTDQITHTLHNYYYYSLRLKYKSMCKPTIVRYFCFSIITNTRITVSSRILILLCSLSFLHCPCSSVFYRHYAFIANSC